MCTGRGNVGDVFWRDRQPRKQGPQLDSPMKRWQSYPAIYASTDMACVAHLKVNFEGVTTDSRAPHENSRRLSAILVLHGIAYRWMIRGEDGGRLIYSACDEAVSPSTPPVLGLSQASDPPVSVNNASVSVDKAVDVFQLLRTQNKKLPVCRETVPFYNRSLRF